ncbi:hypothetical protein DL93DRAFT_2051193 [Clavulina sp. PMI_390]|nr:hypothetical protein DL93DRAFT_2051193 [Clavulina sp. PMI_390]
MKPASLRKPVDTEPIKRLSAAAAKCSVQAQAYGSCMLANYQDVTKGMCAKEFMQFKDCVQNVVSYCLI